MERRDYILLEIEKIGLILTAIKQKLFGGKEKLAITIDKQMEESKKRLVHELNFDLDTFLPLNMNESMRYLDGFKGFNAENTVSLAEYFSSLGFNDNCVERKKYLEKAIQLYTISNLQSKTYSLDRETRMVEIKDALKLL